MYIYRHLLIFYSKILGYFYFCNLLFLHLRAQFHLEARRVFYNPFSSEVSNRFVFTFYPHDAHTCFQPIPKVKIASCLHFGSTTRISHSVWFRLPISLRVYLWQHDAYCAFRLVPSAHIASCLPLCSTTRIPLSVYFRKAISLRAS